MTTPDNTAEASHNAESCGAVSDYIQDQVKACILEARRLRAAEDDDAEPYKSKYAAADLLNNLIDRFTQRKQSDDDVGLCNAHCQLERGLILLETDLTAEGQKALEQSIAFDWPRTVASFAALQQAHNALGGLWCGREEFSTSLKHLKIAAELYSQIQCHVQSHTGNSSDTAESGLPRQQDGQYMVSSSTKWEAELTDVSRVDAHYTTTLYYMAQVYGHAGDKVQSASYCAATLNRQLRAGDFNVNDWVQNCLQLSGYFLDGNAFALSQYCCAAVQKVLLQWHERMQRSSQQHTIDNSTQPQQQQQDNNRRGLEINGASNGSCAMVGSKTDEQQQHQPGQQEDGQTKDQASKPPTAVKSSILQQQQLDSNKPDSLRTALQCLDEDVAANVLLAFAKLHLYTLVASHECYVEGRKVAYSFASAADVPDVLAFDALPDLPALSSLAWGDGALADNAEAALQLFKAALPWFKEAMEYYKLEGWVTEHCNILFEMSNLYRCLAGFEPDPHKRCVMHRQRAKLLQPLEGQLSPQHYPGLSRSISLELGNIYREIGDIKAAAAREPDKVAAAALSSSQHYQLFLDSFKGPNGDWPTKVEQEMEQHYLNAAFCMARSLQTVAMQQKQASAHVVTLEHAVSWLDRLIAYVKDNAISSFEQEAELAEEMASLLREKLALTKRHMMMQQRIKY